MRAFLIAVVLIAACVCTNMTALQASADEDAAHLDFSLFDESGAVHSLDSLLSESNLLVITFY